MNSLNGLIHLEIGLVINGINLKKAWHSFSKIILKNHLMY
uniref:Uncharacterized protein n=1 Tax=Myoviridae sp. ctCo31 TaxID=2825053 RepID=A0A8S5UM11_9CAUD|nr:MAG TPA: hypothetical protein [Myoviridae sp. ctCo31]